MDSISDAYFQAPPVARTFATVALGTSVATHFKLLPIQWFIFHPFYLWKFPPQIWRLATSFLITGDGLGLLFDTYFLYQYLSQLEVGHARLRRKEDLLWYLIFVCGTILCFASTAITVPGNEEDYPHIAINWALDLSSFLFLRALIIAMAYTVTQDQRGMKASFYFITIPAQLTPFCMILINLLFPGGVGVMIVQLHGLVAAHLFDFLSRIWPEFGRTRRNLIPTPQFLTGVVNAVSRLSGNIGAVATQASGGATRGSGGPLPDSWRTRGPGQRLG